jgi:hypothetical protein
MASDTSGVLLGVGLAAAGAWLLVRVSQPASVAAASAVPPTSPAASRVRPANPVPKKKTTKAAPKPSPKPKPKVVQKTALQPEGVAAGVKARVRDSFAVVRVPATYPELRLRPLP